MNVAQHILVLSIRVYRGVISPAKTFLFGPLSHCRFTPSCSAYALDAIIRHGALLGSGLALKRICRCHPWGGCGHDPVPPLLPPTQPRSALRAHALQPNSHSNSPPGSGGAHFSPGAVAFRSGH